MTTTQELYAIALRADESFSQALQKAYGKQAGDIRYQPSRQTSEIQKLGIDYRAKIDAWRVAK